MRILKRGEKGFSLQQMLIAVAIVGALAAVVIPNVARFIRQGEIEAAETELRYIQTAVTAMMVDNRLSTLPNPVNGIPIGSGGGNLGGSGGGLATDNMSNFPDAISNVASGTKVTDPEGYTYSDATDKPGYILFGHDITGSDLGNANPNQTNVNYIAQQSTKGTYTVDETGMVTQVTTGYE